MPKKNIITWIAFFVFFLLTFQLFNKKTPEQQPPLGTILSLNMTQTEYVSGQPAAVKLRNYTDTPITLPSHCPKNPLRVLMWNGTVFEEKSSKAKIDCTATQEITVNAKQEITIDFSYWNYALFGTPGRYKIEVDVPGRVEGGALAATPEFTVVEAGLFRKFFRTAFYQPLYNILVFFVTRAPGRDLGLAIIALTLFIRLILLVPSQRAMISQRRMQELQPKLDDIRRKYQGNKEHVAQHTLQLWKDHKVNPFGSCLPLVVQFPVLIALFYVIQNGLNPDNAHLLYSMLQNADLININTNFLGILELKKINVIVLPLIIGALQFFQLKLAMVKKESTHYKKPEVAKSEMESANKMMTYVMPVMIALFTASVPAGVGLYWGVSTVFALGQQLIVNRK